MEARIPEEEAGSSRFGDRDMQVNYYMGLTYKAMGTRKSAEEYFKKGAESKSRSIGVMSYYQGLCFSEINKDREARELFNSMIGEANAQLSSQDNIEVGVIFGEEESESVRKSRNFTLRGLGNKGLNKMQEAKEDLGKAIELSHSNLWAKVEFDEI